MCGRGGVTWGCLGGEVERWGAGNRGGRQIPQLKEKNTAIEVEKKKREKNADINH